MAEQANSTQQFRQIANFFRALSAKQKLWLAGGTVTVAGLLFAFVTVLSKPDMKVLYSGLQPQDAQALGTKLAASNIEYQLSPDGTSVSVAADKLDAARLQVAAEGSPKSGRMGFELFDKPNWAGSDFSERVNYQRALEGELERTVGTLEGVDSVRVHLVLPRESLFAESRDEGKASVILRLRGNISAKNDVAVRRLVAGAVERLRPENVTVIDAENGEPLSKVSGSGDSDNEHDKALAAELVRTLDPILGAGGVRASVHVEYDESSGDETEERYDPANPATLTLQKSEEVVGGTLPQGIPGTASNIPNTQTPAKSSAVTDTQTSRSENGTYAVNKTLRHTLLPAGRIKRITAALVVDDAQTADGKGGITRNRRTAEELKKIEGLARATLGMMESRGDVLVVENLSFLEVKHDVPAPPTRMEKASRMGRQWSWIVRYALIALMFLTVYGLVIRPIRKQIVQSLLPGTSKSPEKILGGDTGQLLAPMPEEGDASSRQTARMKKQLVDRAKAEPASASQLVQSWLREEEA